MNCNLCKLVFKRDIKTKLYFEDTKVIVVRDIHNRGYKCRILIVWKEHKSLEELDKAQKDYMLFILKNIANVEAKEYNIDYKNQSTPSHAHYQACII